MVALDEAGTDDLGDDDWAACRSHARTVSGRWSGTMTRCPHRSTARARASWTTSSCCSRGPWRRGPTSPVPCPSTCRRSSPTPPRWSWSTPRGSHWPAGPRATSRRSPRRPTARSGGSAWTPAQTRERYPESAYVTVQGPLTTEDLDLAVEWARERGRRHAALVALHGFGSVDALSSVGLVRTTLAAAALLEERGLDADVVAVPLAAHGDPD